MKSKDGKEAYLKQRQKDLIREIQLRNIQKRNQEAQLAVDKVVEEEAEVIVSTPAVEDKPVEESPKKKGRKKKVKDAEE